MRANYLLLVVILGLWGCASGSAERVPAPPEEIKVFYYVGGESLNLKSSPDSTSPDVGSLTLNERVEKVERGQAGWFLVRTQDGRQGWINEKYLHVTPISQFYVRRRVRLLTEPQEQSQMVTRLQPNEQVKLLEQNPQGWAQITVASTGKTGWLKMGDLSVEPVAIRPVRRRYPVRAVKEKEPAGEVSDTKKGAEPPSFSLTPPPAQAAPSQEKKPTPPPKARPEMFEPF